MTVAELDVLINGRIDKLDASLKQAQVQIKGFASKAGQDVNKSISEMGGKIASAGRAMSTTVSLPLIAMGTAAAKLSMDYGDAMAKIQGLAGVSKQTSDQWSKAMLQMAGETGRGPKELADAMYLIASAGIKGANSLDILRTSAKMAESGLGETKTVADAITSAVNAYGEANMSASKAADIMVATVRAGKMPADQLTGALGRVLPIAAQMHVSLANVGASIAAMTRTGLSSDEAVTALRATMATLLHPTKQVSEALALVHMKAAELRKEMAQNLMQALSHIATAFKGNDEALSRVFPNIRALTGVLSLTGAQGKKVAQIFYDVEHSTGAANKAWQIASQTAGHQMRTALASLEAAGIDLGAAMGPVLRKLAEEIKTVADWFQKLTPVEQKTVLITGAVVAAIGPAVTIFGRLQQAIALVSATRVAIQAWSATTVAANVAVQTASARTVISLMAVRTAYLGLAALAAIPIIITIKAVYDYSDAQNRASSAAARAASFAFGPKDYMDMKRREGSKENNTQLINQFKQSQYYQPFMHSGPNGDTRDQRNLEVAKRQLDILKEKADSAEDAIKNAVAAGGGGGGGGGGRHHARGKPQESDAQKEAQRQAEEYKSKIQELTIALKEEGATEDWQKAIIERKYGEYKNYTAAEWAHVYSLIAGKNALDRQADAQEKAREAAQEAAEKAKEAAAEELQQIQEKRKENDRVVREAADGLLKQMDLKKQDTEVEKTRFEMEYGNLKNLTLMQQAYLLALAKSVDLKNSHQAANDRLSKSYSDLDDTSNDIEKEGDDQDLKKQQEALKSFHEYMAKIQADMDRLRGGAKTTQVQMDLMSQSFSKDAVMMQQALAATLSRDKLQQLTDNIKQMADQMTNILDKSLSKLKTSSFGSFFTSVEHGFKQMLEQMATEWLNSQIKSAFTNLLGSLTGLGSIGSSVLSSPSAANGGNIGWLSSLGGSQTPNLGGSGAFGGGTAGPLSSVGDVAKMTSPNNSSGMMIVMNVTTPNAQSFQNSSGQIASQLGNQMMRAVKRS